MKKTEMYRYIGLNGTLVTYILLEGINHSLRYHLVADEGKILTDGTRYARVVEIEASDLSKWREVTDKGQDK